ncbi:hypothetical protein PV761_08930 [Arthrobacter sp. CC3]|uniref:hypothetical protein n=1 Tax=Arthrobacter sp. CC3 TaxID=3029185 RepID=UPI0032670B46
MGLEDKGRNVVIHHLGGVENQSGRLSRLASYGQPGRESQADQAGAKPEEAAEPAPTTDYT